MTIVAQPCLHGHIVFDELCFAVFFIITLVMVHVCVGSGENRGKDLHTVFITYLV